MTATLMTTAKQAVERQVPPAVWSAWSLLYRMGSQLLLPTCRSNLHRLREYKDRHRGERCFILGNGPSLRRTNLHLLCNEYTFGLNRVYLLFPELDFTTTYLVTTNALVVEQFGEQLASLPIPKFVEWDGRHYMPPDPNTIFIRRAVKMLLPHFSTNPGLWFWEGNTVTYVAMQLAYYMGFDPVILIGVDHHFVTQGAPGALVVSEGDDPNHFAGNYFGSGVRWQLPNLAGSERAYRMAREVFAQDGRQILDATIDGKLQVFPKVDYESLFVGR
jgi:hypothetical protein